MSRTNCFLPRRGFCLNLRVRMVKSLMAPKRVGCGEHGSEKGGRLEQLEP